MEKIFNKSIEDVFEQCKIALIKLDINIDYINKSQWLIQASTRASILSWGENIEIKVKLTEHFHTKVIVKSNASSQLFSWGKDSSNEREIINAISKNLSK